MADFSDAILFLRTDRLVHYVYFVNFFFRSLSEATLAVGSVLMTNYFKDKNLCTIHIYNCNCFRSVFFVIKFILFCVYR
jgi:hypothetical protein